MTALVTAAEAAEITRSHWVILVPGAGLYLHGLAPYTTDETLIEIVDGGGADARTGCGWLARCCVPGLSDRLGGQRCLTCCTVLGLPPGVGSPKNDPACRVLLGLPATTTAHLPAGETAP